MRRWFVFRYSSRLACFLLKKPWGRQRKSFPGRWAGKESARNAGEPGSIPGNGKFPWLRDRLLTPLFLGIPCGSEGKESACNVGDLGSISGLGRSPGEENGYPLQYSCLENPHGQRSLAGYSPCGHKESDMTEWLLLLLLKSDNNPSTYQLMG